MFVLGIKMVLQKNKMHVYLVLLTKIIIFGLFLQIINVDGLILFTKNLKHHSPHHSIQTH